MKKLFIHTLSILILGFPGSSLIAQFEVVEYNRQNGWFNNGQALPAESHMIVTSSLPSGTERVILEIFKGEQASDKSPLFAGEWKKDPQSGEDIFRLPVPYMLKGGNTYDFRLTFFQRLKATEQDKLTNQVKGNLDRFLSQYASSLGGTQELAESPAKLVKKMNDIVAQGLNGYLPEREGEFPGFSETVEKGLENLKSVAGNIPAKDPNATQTQRSEAFDSQAKAVSELVRAELISFMSQPVLMETDSRLVSNYPTEKTRNTLAVNLGYGGVYLDGDLGNLSYGTSPYVGISLPLASSSTAPVILKNSSVSLGVFTNNFETSAGETVTGPVFGRPYYLGVGYNLFRFVRLNIGATALETQGASSVGGGSAGIDVNAIGIQPFVGLSAEIDLWVGLRDR
ncbi:MAG: hypothetical protein NWR72_16055 [Bacteroidia bacterium]|nr:hypothetical protein [Bacteroidia bacterium]